MSTLPLLAGLTAFGVAASLTLMGATEAQFQKRALATEAEGLALVVATQAAERPRGLTIQDEYELTSIALEWLPGIEAQHRPKLLVRAYSPDGSTIAVELCESFHSWQLPWLDGIGVNRRVCAKALARSV